MNKLVQIDKKAEKELSTFPRGAQIKFRVLITILEEEGKLELPEGKKLSKGLFEMRFSYENTYRSIYAYLDNEIIIVLSAFVKKTQKTPLKELDKAQKRLQQYI